MSDFSKFRTAVSGFNRTDVVNYIESTSIEHQKALRKLTDERDKLAAENARLQVELAGLQKRLEQAQADNDALSGQVNALAQEGSDLAEQLKKSEEARQELLIRPAPQPEEPAEPAPQPEARLPRSIIKTAVLRFSFASIRLNFRISASGNPRPAAIM